MSRDLYWNPSQAPTKQEQRILKRAHKHRKLFVFLWEYRHELFDQSFQDELITAYRNTGAGKPPHPPAQMLMVVLLQAYMGVSDHEAVELTADSRRWQMILGRFGDDEPMLSASTLYDFRMRMIASGMGQRLLERSVALAREMGGFSDRALRAALDSSPLVGAGRVEDTFNLLAHAARKVLEAAAELCSLTVETVIEQIGLTLFDSEHSLKATLDINWSDRDARHIALQRLHSELELLQDWLQTHNAEACETPPLQGTLETLKRLQEQDLEPDPEGGGMRIREGVAKNRQVSISDPAMRHGRKTQKKRFDGYKRHILFDLDEKLILSVDVAPGNEPDHFRLVSLVEQALKQGRQLESLHIDRGYLPAAADLAKEPQGPEIICKPPGFRKLPGYFNKRDFIIDLEAQEVVCPNGESMTIKRLGETVRFPLEKCEVCPLSKQCRLGSTSPRSIKIHTDEDLHQDLIARQHFPKGREELRERVGVEHGLARISQRQGNNARYRGQVKNVFHLQIQAGLLSAV